MVDDDRQAVDPDRPLSAITQRDLRALVAVAVGGFVGTIARYGVDRAWPSGTGHFPAATFTVNVSGALLIAIVMVAIVEGREANRYLRPLLVTGLLGGWTTMSTLAVDTSTLGRHRHPGVAVAYVGATLAASLCATIAGTLVARSWRGSRGPQ